MAAFDLFYGNYYNLSGEWILLAIKLVTRGKITFFSISERFVGHPVELGFC